MDLMLKFYLMDLKHMSATLSLGQRRNSYLLCGRESTLSFVELRFNGPKTKMQIITLKCIPTEYSPFLKHMKERDLYPSVLCYLDSFHNWGDRG